MCKSYRFLCKQALYNYIWYLWCYLQFRKLKQSSHCAICCCKYYWV